MRTRLQLTSPWSHKDWLPIILLSLISCVTVLFLCNEVEPSSQFTSYHQDQIKTFQENLGDQDVSIVILGNSLARYGFYKAEKLESSLSKKLGKNVKVLTIYRSSGVFYDYKNLTESLLALEPSLFIVQRDLLNTCYGTYTKKMIAVKYWFWKRFRLTSWSIHERNQYQEQVNRELDRKTYNPHKWLFFAELAVKTSYRVTVDSISRQTFDAFYKRATETRSQFLFVDIPRAEKAERVIFSEAPPVTKYPIAFQEPFDDQFFVDPVHLNAEGRKIASKWLTELIKTTF